jgi:hypothetical protein
VSWWETYGAASPFDNVNNSDRLIFFPSRCETLIRCAMSKTMPAAAWPLEHGPALEDHEEEAVPCRAARRRGYVAQAEKCRPLRNGPSNNAEFPAAFSSKNNEVAYQPLNTGNSNLAPLGRGSFW